MDMDLDSLRCFEAAATTLRFRAAAARVHLSAAAFSDRIRRLEESLGVPLLRRTTRRVTLTDAGRRLLPLAREVLAGVERMQVAAGDSPRPLPYELVVGTRYEVGLSWLCPALVPLSRKRPERTIHLYTGSSGDLLWRLERGDLDAVVASMRLTSPRVSYAAVHHERYSLVGATRCLRRRDDARKLILVDKTPDLPLFRYFLDALRNAEPWPFADVEYMGGIGNMRRRVLDCEDRVAVLPDFFVAKDLAAKRLVKLLPDIELLTDALRLVYRTGHPREAQLIALAADLREHPLR